MIVIEQERIGGTNELSMLRLDGPKPLRKWDSAICDGRKLALLLSPGEPDDVMCVKGGDNLLGKEIEFV